MGKIASQCKPPQNNILGVVLLTFLAVAVLLLCTKNFAFVAASNNLLSFIDNVIKATSNEFVVNIAYNCIWRQQEHVAV